MKNLQRPVFIYLQAGLRFRRSVKCRGQTLVEYALILAIISLVTVGILVNIGTQVKSVYSMIDSQVSSAPAAANSTH